MAISSSIQITFEDALRQADKLKNCAGELRDTRTQLENAIAVLRQDWSGEAAERYFYKCQQLSEKLKRSSEDLEKTAETIRTSAKRYYDAEKKALQIIATKSFTSGGGNGGGGGGGGGF